MATNVDEAYRNFVKFKTDVYLLEVTELNSACKLILKSYLCCTETLSSSSLVKIQAVIDYMYEHINIGNWKDVKPFLRKTITIASYLKLLIYIKCSKEFTNDVMKEAYKIIDFGILFGCPLDKNPSLLQNCASYINSLNEQSHTVYENVDIVAEKESNELRFQGEMKTLEVISCPSMEYFYKNHILAEMPVILDKCIDHWPALSKWKHKNYLVKLAGCRTVSIEVGSKYTDSEWTQKLMTIEEFINNHIHQTNSVTGYLAQYQLFDQIPELKNDITEPEYCCFSDTNAPVDINAWYGPKGTVSPLHHDPKKNLLAQVVGEKQIFLFSPDQTKYLYPHEHELLSNTARVDPRNPNVSEYPDYKNSQGYNCILKPGQMLYIPPKWWHFVESLSVSFSVSFWWE